MTQTIKISLPCPICIHVNAYNLILGLYFQITRSITTTILAPIIVGIFFFFFFLPVAWKKNLK